VIKVTTSLDPFITITVFTRNAVHRPESESLYSRAIFNAFFYFYRTEHDHSHLYASVDKQRMKLKEPGSPMPYDSNDHNSSHSDVDLDGEIPLAGERPNNDSSTRPKKLNRNPTLNYTEIEFDNENEG
jgi:hypothetical protein